MSCDLWEMHVYISIESTAETHIWQSRNVHFSNQRVLKAARFTCMHVPVDKRIKHREFLAGPTRPVTRIWFSQVRAYPVHGIVLADANSPRIIFVHARINMSMAQYSRRELLPAVGRHGKFRSARFSPSRSGRTRGIACLFPNGEVSVFSLFLHCV